MKWNVPRYIEDALEVLADAQGKTKEEVLLNAVEQQVERELRTRKRRKTQSKPKQTDGGDKA